MARKRSRRLRPKRQLTFLSLCALGWLLQADALAQDRAVHSFPAHTDIITVDVVVLDGAGRPMRGLRQGDFTVLEDGRPQEVAAFEARDLKASPSAAPASAAPGEASDPTPGRTLAFVVDDLSGFQCVTGVNAIRSWIEEKADARDRVSLFTTSGRVQPVEEPIATGREALLRALDAVRCLPLPGAGAGYYGGGSILGPDADPNAIAANVRAKEVYAAWRTRARAVVSSIEGFSRGHASERGRKPVFVFTEGFPRDVDLKQAEQAIDVAHRTNTTLYFINPRGIGTAMNEGGVGFAGAAHMAAETGGALVSNNDVAGSLARAIDESEVYYLLGYVPGRAPDGKWRRLEVKVSRPGVEVRARRGYLASVEPAAPQTPTTPASATASASSPASPAAPPDPAGGRSTSRAAVPELAPVPFGLPGAARAGEVRLDGAEVVRTYRDVVERYRRNDPADSAEGRALVSQAAQWNLDLARMAAVLAAMPPPTANTVVRLDDKNGVARPSVDWYVPSPGSSQGARGAAAVSRSDDALERELVATRSRPAEAVQGRRVSAPRARDPWGRVSATLGATSRPAAGLGACLVATSPRDCAAVLKAAALLHTDVATASLLRGDHERAAVHRAIAGWLLWHLPQDAQDDAFVREWVLAVNLLLLGDGSLSSARQLGQLGLLRFPNDAALLLSAARANEALATLCYAPEGNPFGGDDCDDTPIAFDLPQPARPLPGNRQSLKQGDVVRETERLLRALAKELPADPEVHLRLGRALAERGRLDEAERELALVVTSSRDTNQVALAHLLLGRLAEARNDAKGALEHARAARTLAPRSQSARMALASALLASGARQGAAQLMADLPTTPNGVDDPWAEFLQGSMLRFVPARAELYGRVKLP